MSGHFVRAAPSPPARRPPLIQEPEGWLQALLPGSWEERITRVLERGESVVTSLRANGWVHRTEFDYRRPSEAYALSGEVVLTPRRLLWLQVAETRAVDFPRMVIHVQLSDIERMRITPDGRLILTTPEWEYALAARKWRRRDRLSAARGLARRLFGFTGVRPTKDALTTRPVSRSEKAAWGFVGLVWAIGMIVFVGIAIAALARG